MIDRAVDKLGERFHDQPEVKRPSRMTLADTYHNLSLYAKAERQAEAALEVKHRVHGPEAAETSTLSKNWAICGIIWDGTKRPSNCCGRRPRACGAHLARTTPIRSPAATTSPKPTTTPDSPAGSNCAGGGDDQAQGKEARLRPPRYARQPWQPGRLLQVRRPVVRCNCESLESTLKLKEAALGPDQPAPLRAAANLAFTYLQAGRFDESITLGEATVKMWESEYGPDHIDTLYDRDNLARSYLAAGRTAEAIKLGESTLKTYESKLGPNHPDTLVCRDILAQAYQAASRLTDAPWRCWKRRSSDARPSLDLTTPARSRP